MGRIAFAALIVFACMVPPWAVAADAPDYPDACETYDARFEAAPLMRIVAPADQAQVHFEKQLAHCRALGGCWASEKNYLVAGDEVFVSKERFGHRCAYYGTAKGRLIAGFLPSAVLAPLQEETTLSREFLVGDWADGGDAIHVRPSAGGKVHGSGSAIWQGLQDPHTGDFEADAVVAGKEAVFVDDACEVHMRRRGSYLLVDDNGQCGGANVRFRGIYVRHGAGAK